MGKTGISIFDDGSLQLRAEARHASHHSDHIVQFYAEDGPFFDSLSRSLGTTLGAGDSAVVIATEAHLSGLAHRLKARGLDTARTIEAGRYVPLEARKTLSAFMVEGWPDATRFRDFMGAVIERAESAAEGDPPRVFAFGEMVALLWAEGKSGSALELEKLWNDLATKHSFSLRCAYPMTAFDREEHGESFLKICAAHTSVIPSENYTVLTDEEQRLRSITYLQQKAQTLETAKAEREQVQRALQSREAELTDLLENAPEGIQQSGSDQRVRWANKALLKLLGYKAEEFVGHPLAEFHVNPHTFEEFWAKLMGRQDIFDFAAELRCKDGSVKNVLINSNGRWDGETLIHTRSFIRDVTERREMERALELAHEQLEARVDERTKELKQKNLQILQQSEALEMTNQGLRKLSARLMQVQDEERRRIARDLHDSTGQSIALLSMNLSALQTEASKSNPELAEGLSENVVIVKAISTELRTLSYLLHPPLLDEMGLESALHWYLDGFGQRSGITVSLECSAELERLSKSLEIAIFRVIQECLTNIHVHAESPTATISIAQSPNKIILEIKDQGKGIAPEKLSKIASSGLAGLGLRGMRERIKDFQGEMEIISLERGTQIKVTVPIAATAS